MRSRFARAAFAALTVVALGAPVEHARAQGGGKALVYCPVGIDDVGCGAIVNALGSLYLGGVDRGYDGAGGTINLATADLTGYRVIVIPSLADDSSAAPYGLLRDPAVAQRLHGVLFGRTALWSGTPDQGTASRTEKDALIQNLATWAGGNFDKVLRPGLVVLQDQSANTASRYDWLPGLVNLNVVADSTPNVFSNVQSVDPAAAEILSYVGGELSYPNMASYGFSSSTKSKTSSIQQTGTTSGQMVLFTVSASVSGAAAIQTDKADYSPGETVIITGTGFKPGEKVTITLQEDPQLHPPVVLTSTADGTGNFTNTQFVPEEHDLGIRFVATAVGDSGSTAQTTFTDSRTITGVTLNGGATVTVSAGESITAIVNVTTDNSGGNQNWRSTGWRISTTPGTVTCIDHPNHDGSNSYVETFTTITAPAVAGTYNAYFIAYSNDACTNQPSGTFILTNGVVVVGATPTVTTITPTSKIYGDAGFTLTVNGTNFTPTSTVRYNGADRTTTYVSTTQMTAAITAADLLSVGTFPITVRNGVGTISNPANFTVNPKPVTPSITAQSKTYNGNTSATILTRTLTGVLAADVGNVTLTGGSANFDTKNVGTGKTVTATGLTLSGSAAPKYVLSSTTATTTADITPLAIVGSITANNKVYDGTTTAIIATRTLAGVISGDVVNYVGGTATFADKNVGNGKTVSATGLSLSGADAGNYTVNTTATTTANITPRPLTITATGVNKVYDGTTAAAVTLADDRVAGDVFTASYTSASFADKNVANAKPVSVVGISISGTDAGNYTFNTTAATTANITPRPLTVSATGINKVYDGNATATVTLADNRVAGDVFTTSYTTAAFNNKNAGTGKPVNVSGISISGTDAGNYTVNMTAATTADITPRPLTITATGINKVYDGTTTATVTLADNRVAGDVFTASYTTATFADKNVGTGKAVSVSGISTSGTDAGNYTHNTTAATTADITPRPLTVSATGINKVYDGNATATVTLTDNRVAGDVFTASYTTAAFNNKNVGTAKAVSVSGISISGTDAGNYSFNTTAATTADITPRPLTITATGINKVYDGTTTATVNLADNRLTGDVFTASYATATFINKNVGTGKPVSVSGISLSGADAGNYTHNTTASTTADITPRPLTITAAGINKVYDGNATATVTLADDRVAGDVFTASYTTAAFNNKNVGNGKPVSVSGISISGTDAGNYTFNTTATTTANITPLAIVGSITANNKVYDGTVAAVIATRTLAGVISGDVVNYVGGTATFADKNVGNGKTVSATGLSLSGADAGNYTVNTTATTTANITPRPLTITATGVNKVYDGTTAAAVTLADDRVAGDVFTASYTSASFADKNVANAKPVSVVGISISGTDAGNYTFNTTATTTADITPLAIVGSITANNKVYDGTTTAIVATRTLAGVISGDLVNYVGGTATFADKNVGNGKTVSATGLSLSGADAGNYTVNTTAATTANITVRPITVTAATDTKVYDRTTSSAATPTVTTGTVASGDVGNFTQTFDTRNVGTNKTLTPAGAVNDGNSGNNYLVTFTPVTTGTITPLGITGNITADNKVYDGNTTATILTRTLTGVIGPDVVTYTGGTATFDNRNVGTGKTVTGTGLSLAGADAGNYSVNATAVTTANITARPITVTAATDSRVYNATTSSAGIPTVTSGSIVSPDAGTFTQTFDNKNVGTNKTLTPAGSVNDGNSGNNYNITFAPVTTGTITALAITGSITAANKVYDATTAATILTRTLAGVLGLDVVTYVGGTATFSDKNVGNGKTVTATGLSLSGADAGNYTVNTSAVTTANITPLAITGNITADNRVYDGTTAATIATRTLTGVLLTDVVTYTGGTATFDTKHVGTGKTVTGVGLSLAGADAGNYTVNATAATTANITVRPITVTAATDSKVYDRTTSSAATPTVTTGTVASGDVGNFTQTFDTRNVGTNKTLTPAGAVNDGNSGNNYLVTFTPVTTGTITPLGITGNITAANKVYDATTAATILTRTLTGVIAPDVVTYDGGTATFSDKNAANGKTVTGVGLGLIGADAGNYTVNTTATTTADITPKPLTISVVSSSKNFGAVIPPALAFSVMYSAFAGAETPAVLTGTLVFTPGAATFTNTTVAGVYPIAASGLSSPNYGITYVPGTFTIFDTTAPIVSGSIANPNPVPLNTPITLTANISDATTGGSNISSACYRIDTSGVPGPCIAMNGTFGGVTANVSATIPGSTLTTADVFEVCIYGTDSASPGNTNAKMDCVLVAVYDPSAGFVTGGGWITSPVGAYVANPALTGKATFGFVAKYKKGQQTPEGNTEFQFQAAGMNFKATSYEWLVVAGSKAQYKGVGTVNGTAGYGFMLTALDGDASGNKKPDSFRMKIWRVSDGSIVYDNNLGASDTGDPTTMLGGGSIVIHN